MPFKLLLKRYTQYTCKSEFGKNLKLTSIPTCNSVARTSCRHLCNLARITLNFFSFTLMSLLHDEPAMLENTLLHVSIALQYSYGISHLEALNEQYQCNIMLNPCDENSDIAGLLPSRRITNRSQIEHDEIIHVNHLTIVCESSPTPPKIRDCFRH